MENAFILCAGITLVLLGSYGTYQGLVVAPLEETMGDAQRIFYYHRACRHGGLKLALCQFRGVHSVSVEAKCSCGWLAGRC